jgi:hypothetical protein
MSFSRDNQLYKSLPVNSSNQGQRYINQVSLNMPTASTKSSSSDNSTLTNSSSSSGSTTTGSSVTKPNPIVNSEEFAKLDALLEDLLAEVDQPIFLSKTPHNKKTAFKSQLTANVSNGHCVDDVERSVDWLTEQKELLRARKDMSNNTPPYRSIKSKLDYYLNNNLNDVTNGKSNKFAYSNGTSTYNNQLNNSFNPIDESILIDQGDDFKNNASIINIRPPSTTPSVRPPQPLVAVNPTQFRSLSTNPNLLVIFSRCHKTTSFSPNLPYCNF